MCISKRAVAALASAVFLWGGSLASAATIKADFLNVNPKVNISVSRNSGSSFVGLQVGQLNWKEIAGGSTTLVGVGNNFSTYCIDISQFVEDPTTFSVSNDPNSVPVTVPAVGSLNTNWVVGDRTKVKVLGQLYNKYFADVNTNVEAAAFQLAIWKIVFETFSGTQASFSTGLVRASGTGDAATAISTASTWLNWLTSNQSAAHGATFTYLSSASGQDQLHYVPLSPGPVPIPVPLASVGGMALIGMLAAKRTLR